MDYEWDLEKAAENARKHGIRFSDAVSAFADRDAVTIEDSAAQEERFVTLELDAMGRILAVVFTFRGERIRVISARKATPVERDHYGRRRG